MFYMNKFEKKTIEDFGNEWTVFNQSNLDIKENKDMFEKYFKILPPNIINSGSNILDAGCGTGRWAYFFAPFVKKIYCLEPSNAISVAKKYLGRFNNIIYINKLIDQIEIPDNSIDFCYCLGVLHHTINPENNLKILVKKIKKNSPLILYIYYNLENRSIFYKSIWIFSTPFRLIISRLPFKFKILITNLIALFIYFPLSRIAKLLSIFNLKYEFIPLSYYMNKSLSVLKNDSLDRFGTIIEKRYSKKEVENMMKNSGLHKIKFSDSQPYWCVIGYKK